MSVASRTRSKSQEKARLKLEKEAKSRWENVPQEISDEIFWKLPGNSILSSRCVCKLFKDRLSKPRFIKNHVHLSIHTKNSNPKLLFSGRSPSTPPMIYSMPLDYASLSSSSPAPALLMNYPFESAKGYSHSYMGSCNGLICIKILREDRIDYVRGNEETNYFSILNPFTRQYKEFRMQTVRQYGYGIAYGFGYDSSIDDYKLVAISDNGGCSNVEVYSVRSNSRSNTQCALKYSFHGGRIYGCPGVFFNGALHWLGSIANQETSSEVVLCYDISNGIMVNMPLPDILPMPPTNVFEKVLKNVGVLEDCIFVAFIWRSIRMDVWVMGKYGVNESWFRKYTTTQLPLSLYPSAFWKPLWCFDTEVLVDDGSDKLYLFDPTTETFRSVVVSDIIMDALRNRVTYVESIASLGSSTYLKRQIKDGTGKNPKRERLR